MTGSTDPKPRRWARNARRVGVLSAAALILSSCGWRGIANVPLPGGPGTVDGHSTIYIQMPQTLGLNANSRVRVADVFVGRVRAIELKNWIPTLTVDLNPGIHLPRNVLAKIGQTSLLGSQHVELDEPPNPSSQQLKNGDTIELKNSSAFPTIERTLAGISGILTGGGVPNIEKIQSEVYNILNGRADQIKDFLHKLDTFTDEINQQRDDITRAIRSSDTLLKVVADRNETLDRVLTETPPLIEHFNKTQDLFTNAVLALGRLSKAVDTTLSGSNANLHTNL
ncbi:MCE family protein, partial [Mycolicibacterium sp. CBMA 361]